jgi:hypothetical protein
MPYYLAISYLMHVVINSRLDGFFLFKLWPDALSNLGHLHWQASKHVMNYFKSSIGINVNINVLMKDIYYMVTQM